MSATDVKKVNIMDMYKEDIIMIDGMPCIVLKNNTLDDYKPIRGVWNPPIQYGLQKQLKKDFTQLQFEKTQKFLKELLDEIKTHGYIFY